MKKDKIIYIIIIVLILGFVIYKKFIEVPGHIAGQMAIEDLISQVYYEDAEKYFENIFIKTENKWTSSPLPEFENINDAPEGWIWMVLYNNLENEENIYTYEQIQEQLVILFSENFDKKFPEEGIQSLINKDKETGKYYKVELENNGTKNYRFCIKSLTQEDTTYKINIIEYTFLDDTENSRYILVDKEENEIEKYDYKNEQEKLKIEAQIESDIIQNQYNLAEKQILIEIETIEKPNVISIISK